MPIYEYNGQFFDLQETDPAAAKAKIQSHLGETTTQPAKTSLLDKLKGTPDWMVSKPGQGWDDANAQAAGGDVTNPMAYLSDAQKTEQGAAMKAVGQGVNRAVQMGAGIAKGAVLNPVAAVAELTAPITEAVGAGPIGRDFSTAMQQSYEQQRKTAGAEGFDWAELFGAFASPVNKFIPGGGAKTATGKALTLADEAATTVTPTLAAKIAEVFPRAAASGALGSILNPVAQENMSTADWAAEKAKQAALGAAFGGVMAAAFPAFKAGARELLDRGVELKPGQAFGGAGGALMRQAESFVETGKRLLGREATNDKINRAFTLATVDEVVSTIGQKLPKVYGDGQEAVDAGVKIIKNEYPKVFNNLGKVQADDEFMSAIRNIRDAARNVLDDAEYAKFDKEINRNIVEKFKPAQGIPAGATGAQPGVLQTVFETDGQKLHDIKRYLQSRLRNLSGATEGAGPDRADLFRTLMDDFNNFVYKADPSGSIRAVDKAYADINRVAGAAQKAATNNGNFSPTQLVREAASQASRLQGGSGIGPMQQYAKEAQKVIGKDQASVVGALTPSDLKNLGVASGLGYTGLFNLPVIAGLGVTGLGADILGKVALTNPALYEQIRNTALNQTGRLSQGLFAAKEKQQ